MVCCYTSTAVHGMTYSIVIAKPFGSLVFMFARQSDVVHDSDTGGGGVPLGGGERKEIIGGRGRQLPK